MSAALAGFILIALSWQTPATDQMTAVQSAETTWAAQKITAYEYTIELTCFCYMDRRQVTFRVANGTSTLVDKVDPRFTDSYASYGTIEKLFAILRRTAKMGPHKMKVEYDPAYGYPRSADLDPREMVKDDELRFTITGFKPLAAEKGK